MTVKATTKLLSAAAFACTSIFAAGAAAQSQTQAPAAQQQAAPVSDAEVKKFAKVEKKITSIAEEWAPKVQTAESQEAAEQIQGQAQAEMVAAIEGEGLTVQRYNEIFAQAQADADLAERIRENA